MDNPQKTGNASGTKPAVLQLSEVAWNENPKANENIRVKTDSPPLQKTAASEGVGSEITDGEDA